MRVNKPITDIVVYGAPWCHHCKSLQKELKAVGLSFSYVDIDESMEGVEFLMAINAPSIPQVVVSGKHIGGRSDTLKALNINKLFP